MKAILKKILAKLGYKIERKISFPAVEADQNIKTWTRVW